MLQMVFPDQEKAILVGVELEGRRDWPVQESLAELSSLALTAGAKVVTTVIQSRNKPDLKYFIGTGKLDELKERVVAEGANLVIFDSELGPAQVRNLEEALGIKVIDRTSLILDIFAQHAHSREGKLQVELAQSTYNLTHLVGEGIVMSRLGGGIGTRGPGETKLEMDRRVIRTGISKLKKEIEAIRDDRALKRMSRKAALLPTVAIVGYTNAGKSTLFNIMTHAEVLVQDKLFATLDPTVRKLKLPTGWDVLVSDTVGFIHKLPHQLVEAFHATLEEVTEADMLIHVVDITSPFMEDRVEAVYRVLEEIRAISKPMITVFNKIDLLEKKALSRDLKKRFSPCLAVSAAKEFGIGAILEELGQELEKAMVDVKFEIPMNEMELVHLIHEKGRVKSEKYLADRVAIEARVSDVTANRLKKYVII